MNCVFLARVVDVYDNSFTGKDGKEVNYTNISVIDEDAFMDKDRVFVIRTNQDMVKGMELLSSYWQFKGVLTTDRGNIKFKCQSIEEVKNK